MKLIQLKTTVTLLALLLIGAGVTLVILNNSITQKPETNISLNSPTQDNKLLSSHLISLDKKLPLVESFKNTISKERKKHKFTPHTHDFTIPHTHDFGPPLPEAEEDLLAIVLNLELDFTSGNALNELLIRSTENPSVKDRLAEALFSKLNNSDLSLDEKDRVYALLATIPATDVVRHHATELLINAKNINDREQAYLLLNNNSNSIEIAKNVWNEQDPIIAQKALDLIRVRSKADYTQQELIEAKNLLNEVYNSHTNIEVQVNAFNKLVSLENNDTSTQLVSDALYSHDISFRVAAVSQISSQRFNTEENKLTLIDIIVDANSPNVIVSAAINSLLTSFDLNEEERQTLKTVRDNNPDII